MTRKTQTDVMPRETGDLEGIGLGLNESNEPKVSREASHQ